MTAFNNIKTNNWPSASNDLEDFLVLELPLNDQAALTSSRRDIVAGSTVLYPKRTLTNTGVSMEASDPNAGTTINIATSEYSTSGTVSNAGNLFDGDTSTTVSSADGARIYWTPASNISVTKFEVYFSSQYSGYKIGVEVTGGSSQVITKSNPGNSPGWVEFTSIAGDTIGPSNQIKFRSYRSNDSDPGILGINAIRVNDKLVVTASAGTPKKHYDDAASFNNSSSYLRPPDSSNFAFGTDDFTVECWIYTKAHKNYIAYIDTRETGQTDAAGWTLATNASGNLYVYSAGFLVNSNLSLNQWTHVAYCRASGTHALYVNGSLAQSSTTARDYTDDKLTIGANSYGGSEVHNGYLQDVRIYKGLAKYTANFTPPGAILG